MSLLSEITKPIKSILGGVGSGLNSITGQTSAGKVNQAYAKELAAINQQYALQSAEQSQKYAQANMALQNQYEVHAAKNAHQWEVQDLRNAGINPILSAGGQGAQADTGLINASTGSGSAGAGSQGASSINILDSLTSAGKTMKEISNIAAQTENTGADTALKTAQTAGQITANKFISPEKKASINNQLANATLNSARATTEATQQALNKEKMLTENSIRGKNDADASYQLTRSKGFTDTEEQGYESHLGIYGGGSSRNRKISRTR